MPDAPQNDSDGGVLRGAIFILLAGIVIGIVFNSLLRASNGGDRGLAWFRQEVKLARLEEVVPDSAVTAANPSDSSMAAQSADTGSLDGESDGAAVAETVPPPERKPSPVPPPTEIPVADASMAEVPPTETPLGERPSAAAEPAAGEGTAAASRSLPSDSIPAIPESEEPLLVQHRTVMALHTSGAAIFVDARSAEEFAAGHISGAVNLPFDSVYEDPTLIDRLGDTDKPVVCYCDGGECELAENLAFVLIDAGYRKVLVYDGGTTAWRAAGEKLVTAGGDAP